MRYGIAVTYNCNRACERCNRFINLFPWPGSDLTVEEVKEGGRRLRESGLLVDSIRLTGGEPLVNPNFAGVAQAVVDGWGVPSSSIKVMTNHTIERPEGTPAGIDWCRRPKGQKEDWHLPWMLSPADLGYRITYGPVNTCFAQRGCGLGFDHYGFSPCVHAGALGRLFGIDPYSAAPVEHGNMEICQHCISSISRKKQLDLWRAVEQGGVQWPTPTYAAMLKRLEYKGPMKFKVFLERK